MNISTEKTPQQKLSNFTIQHVSAVNVTHLLIHDLKDVAQASDELNQQAGCNKAIPHVAARNIKHEHELENSHTTLEHLHRSHVLLHHLLHTSQVHLHQIVLSFYPLQGALSVLHGR